MGILSGNPKNEPLHYGEIFGVWTFSMKAKTGISTCRALQFHAGDKDLKKILGDLINQAELEASECDEILRHNGIQPPPELPKRLEAKLEDIPVGARVTDQEIAPMIGADVSSGLIACSQIIGTSVREDIAALFGKYHATKEALSMKILRMMKEKGWLIPPPLQIQRPELVEA